MAENLYCLWEKKSFSGEIFRVYVGWHLRYRVYPKSILYKCRYLRLHMYFTSPIFTLANGQQRGRGTAPHSWPHRDARGIPLVFEGSKLKWTQIFDFATGGNFIMSQCEVECGFTAMNFQHRFKQICQQKRCWEKDEGTPQRVAVGFWKTTHTSLSNHRHLKPEELE